MNTAMPNPALIVQSSPGVLALSGAWTASCLEGIPESIRTLLAAPAPAGQLVLDASDIARLDSAGAWVLSGLLNGLQQQRLDVTLKGLSGAHGALIAATGQYIASHPVPVRPASSWRASVISQAPALIRRIGEPVISGFLQARDLLIFTGKTSLAFATCLAHPSRFRWRPILFNIRTAGIDALPIVGLISMMLGLVVAYQSADQLRNYGASIFVADIVGLSMVREFSPLIVAIIIAGRSGSAYAAQIGTMKVTEELDAMATIGIEPLELLVMPKLLAMVLAMPLLTVFSDYLGIAGGMVMASQKLGIGYVEFLDRLVKAVSVSSVMTGLGKAPVFAVIIVIVGCFQGFRARGGADSVGRQTTTSVVQSIFLVIVADALFSLVFNALDL